MEQQEYKDNSVTCGVCENEAAARRPLADIQNELILEEIDTNILE